MSHWEKINSKEIEVSDDGKTLEVYIGSDDFGANYIELEIDYIKKLICPTTKKK